jgi:phosphatidylglycerophosphatase A
LAAIPLYLLMQPLPLWIYLLLTVAGFVLGVWICDRTARDLGVHDHPAIVWDEVIGYWITMIAAPPGWLWIGFGIMFDDVLAAGYAWLVVQGLAWMLL